MPRKPRFNLIGIPQHVIQRGNNRDIWGQNKKLSSAEAQFK